MLLRRVRAEYKKYNRGQLFVFVFKILFIYSWQTKNERGRDIGRGRSRLPVGGLVQDSILRPQDHNLSQRQPLNHWATQASLQIYSCFSLLLVLLLISSANLWLNNLIFRVLCLYLRKFYISNNAVKSVSFYMVYTFCILFYSEGI